jgi:hypothetical protein
LKNNKTKTAINKKKNVLNNKAGFNITKNTIKNTNKIVKKINIIKNVSTSKPLSIKKVKQVLK